MVPSRASYLFIVNESLGRASEARTEDNECDSLTAVLTRPALTKALAARVSVAGDAPCALCLIDLDHFKNINLSHGPSRGDDALREIAARLVRTITTTSSITRALVARYDGDAFAVVLDARSHDELATLAETLRRAVSASPSAGGAALTASVGATGARPGEHVDRLLVRAEQALFLAKQFGRDRVEIAPSPEAKRAPAAVVPLRRNS